MKNTLCTPLFGQNFPHVTKYPTYVSHVWTKQIKLGNGQLVRLLLSTTPTDMIHMCEVRLSLPIYKSSTEPFRKPWLYFNVVLTIKSIFMFVSKIDIYQLFYAWDKNKVEVHRANSEWQHFLFLKELYMQVMPSFIIPLLLWGLRVWKFLRLCRHGKVWSLKRNWTLRTSSTHHNSRGGEETH